MRLLGGIKKLLHEDGMTIKSVQKLLREEGVKHVAALSQPLPGEEAEPLRRGAQVLDPETPRPPRNRAGGGRREELEDTPVADAAPAPSGDDPVSPAPGETETDAAGWRPPRTSAPMSRPPTPKRSRRPNRAQGTRWKPSLRQKPRQAAEEEPSCARRPRQGRTVSRPRGHRRSATQPGDTRGRGCGSVPPVTETPMTLNTPKPPPRTAEKPEETAQATPAPNRPTRRMRRQTRPRPPQPTRHAPGAAPDAHRRRPGRGHRKRARPRTSPTPCPPPLPIEVPADPDDPGQRTAAPGVLAALAGLPRRCARAARGASPLRHPPAARLDETGTADAENSHLPLVPDAKSGI